MNLSPLLTTAAIAISLTWGCAQSTPVSSEPAAAPTPTVATTTITTPEPVAAATQTTKSGSFAAGEHATSGTAQIVQGDNGRELQFTADFQTSNGPDLVVVLHKSADVIGGTTPPAYPLAEGDYVVLAPLTAPSGAQTYVIPDDINLEDYVSVAIWCRQFNATFGAAALQ
jgi:hypothetical protein